MRSFREFIEEDAAYTLSGTQLENALAAVKRHLKNGLVFKKAVFKVIDQMKLNAKSFSQISQAYQKQRSEQDQVAPVDRKKIFRAASLEFTSTLQNVDDLEEQESIKSGIADKFSESSGISSDEILRNMRYLG